MTRKAHVQNIWATARRSAMPVHSTRACSVRKQIPNVAEEMLCNCAIGGAELVRRLLELACRSIENRLAQLGQHPSDRSNAGEGRFQHEAATLRSKPRCVRGGRLQNAVCPRQHSAASPCRRRAAQSEPGSGLRAALWSTGVPVAMCFRLRAALWSTSAVAQAWPLSHQWPTQA